MDSYHVMVQSLIKLVYTIICIKRLAQDIMMVLRVIINLEFLICKQEFQLAQDYLMAEVEQLVALVDHIAFKVTDTTCFLVVVEAISHKVEVSLGRR